jgi:hypothetical protein
MKPILTPCSFSNFSWKRLRISITGAMFTSLKVVRMALTTATAAVARPRGHAGGSSARAARGARPGSARTPACTWASAGLAAAGAAAGAAGLAPPATAPRTSPLVTRPSLPVPGTEPEASLLSAMILAAAGIATPALEPPVAAAADAGAGAAAAGAGAAAAGAGAAAARLALGIDLRDQLLGQHRGAIGHEDFAITPGWGPALPAPPCRSRSRSGFRRRRRHHRPSFFHCSMVASATDSDSCGTLTSTIAI